MPYIVDYSNNRNIIKVNCEPSNYGQLYNMTDIHSVYTIWDSKLCRNVEVENKLKGDNKNGKD